MTPVIADTEAEAVVIGLALYEDPHALPTALDLLDPSDFHSPTYSAIWSSIAKLYANGAPVDQRTVANELRTNGHGDVAHVVADLVGPHVPLASRMPHYAGIVIDHAQRRLVQRVALAAAEAVGEGADAATAADTLTAALADVDRPDAGQLPERFSTIREFLDRPGDKRAPWVIPGLLRQDWRAVIVAPEGLGKSVVLRSLAGYTARGVHPFTAEIVEPVRALVVDLENPDEPIDDTFRHIDGAVRGASFEEPDRAWLWRCQEGMDIRSRTDQRRLELVLQHARPDLVCIGPAYKLFNARRGEEFDQVAGEVFHALDSLRTRYGFALAMEHHAPHGESRDRELRPFGSSAWRRWPELGLTLDPTAASDTGWPTGHLMKVGRFRADRVKHGWPRWITRDRQLLWRGHYDQGPPVPTTDRRLS